VFAEVRTRLPAGRHFSSTPAGGLPGFEQLGIGQADDFLWRAPKQRGHAKVHIDIAARGQFFDGQQGVQPRHHPEQHRTQRTFVQIERGGELTRPHSEIGKRCLHQFGH